MTTDDLIRQERSKLIKRRAQEVGFDFCGISRAEFLEQEAPRLEKWLALNHHGGEAATAASLLGAVNFGLAGLISPIVGVFGVTNAIPMGSIMGIAATLSILIVFTVVRPWSVPALSR